MDPVELRQRLAREFERSRRAIAIARVLVANATETRSRQMAARLERLRDQRTD